MIQSIRLTVAIPALLAAGLAWAQEEAAGGQAPEMTPEQRAMAEAWERSSTPGEPHARLAESAGTWNVTTRVLQGPGGEPEVTEGTVEREAILGGRVIRETFSSTFMGRPFHGVAHTGFDNVTGKFWTTWFDNMSTGLYSGEGECNGNYSHCTYTVSGPNAMTGEDEFMRIEAAMDGETETHTFYENRGGEEVRTMELIYTRADS